MFWININAYSSHHQTLFIFNDVHFYKKKSWIIRTQNCESTLVGGNLEFRWELILLSKNNWIKMLHQCELWINIFCICTTDNNTCLTKLSPGSLNWSIFDVRISVTNNEVIFQQMQRLSKRNGLYNSIWMLSSTNVLQFIAPQEM